MVGVMDATHKASLAHKVEGRGRCHDDRTRPCL